MTVPADRHAPLPAAPVTWALPDEGNDVPSGAGGSFSGFDERFAGIALHDDAFDAPVYRSLSGGLFFEATDALNFDAEPPVYRSLSVAAPVAPPASVEEADR